ncbi:MAG: hypothetical protein WCD18_17105 [Thermosynechococcaceae cyanobacterium]
MSGMRRADRQNSNNDNERNNPHARKLEPLLYHELKQQRDNARADKYLLKQEKEQLQQQLQTSQDKVDEWEERTTQNYQLYLDEQQKYKHTLCLYNEENARAIELLAKYEEVEAQRVQYLTLYNTAQTQLKFEKSSKASIKGWETRRKNENERLKQQISDMVVLLRESIERKEESINYLYLMGDRMNRIQHLMDSAELESNQDPVGLLEKLMRIWLLVQKILAE